MQEAVPHTKYSRFLPLLETFNIIPIEGKNPSSRFSKKGSVNVAKKRPLHKINFPNFFTDQCTGVGVLLEKLLNCVDFDCKYDLTGKLFTRFMQALKYALPDVYENIVITTTPNGGYHIFFRCVQSGGKKTLAQRKATPEEMRTGERVKVLIENLPSGSYIPSPLNPGYELIKGEFESFESFPLISPEDRETMLAICKSFDQIKEVEIIGISRNEAKREDAPWKKFNQENNWQWMLNELLERGWENVDESDEEIIVKRPGTTTNKSGTLFKENNILYLFSTSTEFPAEESITAFSLKSYLEFDGDWKQCAKYLAEIGYGTFNAEQSEFYDIDEKKKVTIKFAGIVDWMNEIGIKKIRQGNVDFDLVQTTGNVIRNIPIDKVKKVFCEYIKPIVPKKIYDHFLKSISSIFSSTGIISLLDDLDKSEILGCKANDGYLFFSNTALYITRSDLQMMSYEDLPGLVWEENIIPRNYTDGDKTGDIEEFIKLISKENEAAFISLLGYLLHKYKDPANPKVGILNDAAFDQNETEPSGGTGKGLCIQILSKFKTCAVINGKTFDPEDKFALQRISLSTDIIAIEDLKKGVSLEKFFSHITDGITVQKKFKDEFHIPYSQSPKILITTNYALKGESSSYLRRRFDVELTDYFSDKYTPLDHFGHRFFDDWSHEQWSRFDRYMVDCLQSFLTTGLVPAKNINLRRKRLIQDTHRDFVQWMALMATEEKIPAKVAKDDFKKQFVEMFPDHDKKTLELFTKWVIRWCKEMGLEMDASNKYNGKMTYHFKGEILRAYEKWKLVNEPDKFVNEDQSEIELWQGMEAAPKF